MSILTCENFSSTVRHRDNQSLAKRAEQAYKLAVMAEDAKKRIEQLRRTS